MNTVLVTGAGGFLGQPLCAELVRHGYTVRAAVRTAQPALPGVQTIVTGDIGALTEWRRALEGVEMVVHAAARTHVLHDSAANAHRYFEINAQGTEQLARAAAAAGVRRFIYLSSIKVNGESTTERPYRSDDAPCPQDDYGRSKLQAEDLAGAGRSGHRHGNRDRAPAPDLWTGSARELLASDALGGPSAPTSVWCNTQRAQSG